METYRINQSFRITLYNGRYYSQMLWGYTWMLIGNTNGYESLYDALAADKEM